MRPAPPRPPRALLARQPGWPVTRFPRSPEAQTTHLDGEILALPKQLRRPGRRPKDAGSFGCSSGSCFTRTKHQP